MGLEQCSPLPWQRDGVRHLKVLVACESSGKVREAFRRLGHDAWSNDVLDAEDGSQYHMMCDATQAIKEWDWDLMIGHPPCTYLCNSGVWALHRDEERWTHLEAARVFFMTLWNAEIPKICLENPIPHKYAQLPEYTQTIQPFQFGDDASKRTCLWLKGLPKLSIPPAELWTQPRIVLQENHLGEFVKRARWANQTDSGQNKLGPSETRASERSRTYDGIANAFAEQWGQAE